MRPLLALALSALLVSASEPAFAAKAKKLKNSLISVAEPHPGEPAKAHPFVNVILVFGRLSDGTPADPTTFKARMGREDITGTFTATYDARGKQTGVRGKLEANRVKLGRRPRNVLRFTVQAQHRAGSKGRRVRDTDRLRFGAVETPNQPCTAQADADTGVIVPGVAIGFTASNATIDPDRDELSYLWTFGDGTTSSDANPQHVYEQQIGDITATMTASDGQDSCTDTVKLEAVPALDPGKTPGTIFVRADAVLEFGAVALGGSVTRTLTLQNSDATDTSQVKVRIASTAGGFQVSETSISLGPGESHDVTLAFTPQATGHQDARFSLVANASNRQALSLLAHGFGGQAPNNGPTFAADPVFFTEVATGLFGLGTYGYMPDGRKFFSEDSVHTCVVPGSGLGTGDFCLTDQDCAPNGGTCSTSSACLGGPNAGQPCSQPSDCPSSYCPSYSLFDPIDLCSDGQSLYLLSDEGTFTEPDPNAETERAVTIMRMDLDANGNVTNRDILGRTTTETAHMACDGFPAGQGGQLYIPEYHNVPDDGTCFRSDREALLRVAKSNGNTQVIAGRADAYESLADCDDLDPINQLEVSRDGARMLAGFESGGLWQIRPSPLFYSIDITELFQLHPDGSVIYASTTESGSTGFVNLYRITPDQVQHGPLPYSSLVPCASFPVPNNTMRNALGRTVVISLAASRAAVGSQDAVALVSFAASSQGLSQVLSPSLLPTRGTVAFEAPANSSTCSVLGLINLEANELAF